MTEKPILRSEVLGSQGDLAKSLSRGGKEQLVGRLGIGEKDRVQDVGHRENDVVVLGGQ